MILGFLRSVVSRRPGWVVGLWILAAVVVGVASPDLTRLAAEGQSKLLGREAESRRAAALLAEAWPGQACESLAVATLHRPEGLTEADQAFARRLSARFEADQHVRPILRVLGPASEREIAERMVSADRTVALIAVPLSSSFVSPLTHEVVSWLQSQPSTAGLEAPPGLRIGWTGDAVLGRDYMGAVQTSLNRAAGATVVLLLVILLVVYRSFWLALVPLTTIGVSLVVSRSVLAWMTLAGWEISPLVELFLVALLFGSGTDFCLFVSWRFAEEWDPSDPAGAMRATLRNSWLALVTSAGTVIVGLSLMGTTRFKLFSSTGPSVALGLALTLAATLTLTPALLVLLAKYRPRSFRGMMTPASGLWEQFGRKVMARPLLSWACTLLVMVPFAVIGLRTRLVQDIMTELPVATASAETFRLLDLEFEPGLMAPLTVALESDTDLRGSEGLALIDDLSRFLTRQRRLTEVRSATQPLGSPKPLEAARIAARLGQVNDGFNQISDGASLLQRGLAEGAVKLRAALWLEARTGLSLTGSTTPSEPREAPPAPARGALAAGFKRASAALLGTGIAAPWGSADLDKGSDPATAANLRKVDPRQRLIDELVRAAAGAGQIAAGAGRARHEIATILDDPVGRRALDRLLVNAETVKDHPELNRSLATYITADGHRARIELAQAERVFSGSAMDQVETLRRRVNEFLADAGGPRVRATIAGSNAEAADIRALTRSDQFQSWFVVPIGVFVVLLIALRDPLACLNLVGTMLLTYAFALGATHLLFVTFLGAAGLDWKVPYFLFVLLVAIGVDYNVFLMARLREETRLWGLRQGVVRAIGQTGGLISSAAAITACSFASFLSSPLGSLRQLGFALVVGIAVDAVLVRPLLVPCGHWLLARRREPRRRERASVAAPHRAQLVSIAD